MPERKRNIAWAMALVALASILAVLIATAPSTSDRVESLGSRIMCPVCQGESIADSPADMAVDMMELVRERVDEGRSDEDIISELLSGYSGAVLLDPPVSGATLALWLAPLAALLVGLGVIIWWRRHPGEGGDSDAPPPDRRWLTAVGLLVAFAATVFVAGLFIRDREGPATGVAAVAPTDLDDVSNETMEAIIAENTDNPQINGMRLALAERYYGAGDFSSAFPHYLAVAESPSSNADEAVAALVRLGWMAWEGNGAADAAIGLFDEALEIDASASTARYLKGRVLWCSGDAEQAEALLSELADGSGLTDDSRQLVESDLASIRSGEACT